MEYKSIVQNQEVSSFKPLHGSLTPIKKGMKLFYIPKRRMWKSELGAPASIPNEKRAQRILLPPIIGSQS
jgi:hypothetical protein